MARPAKLSKDRIVEAATRLVDRDGADALTMRALARELGVDPMAVYRHVANKGELLGLLCDALIAELPPIDPEGAWEEQVRGLAAALRERLLARPGLLPVLAAAPSTPASVVVADRAIALLSREGLEPRQAAAAFGAVFSYVLGFAMLEASLPEPADPEALRDPALQHPDAALELMNGAGDFELGLDLVLRGIRARLADVP